MISSGLEGGLLSLTKLLLKSRHSRKYILPIKLSSRLTPWEPRPRVLHPPLTHSIILRSWMVKVPDTHLQMVLLHLSLVLKGVRLLLHLFPLVLTCTNRDVIMEDLLLIPLRPPPSVGSGLITEDVSRKIIVHLNGVIFNSFPSPWYQFLFFRFYCAFPFTFFFTCIVRSLPLCFHCNYTCAVLCF